MKTKLIAALWLLFSFQAFAATATITGTITDLSGAVVASGQVTFLLQPGLDTTISGTARFVPSTVTCGINGSGLVKNLALSAACTVTTNTSLTPSGTWYQVCIWPGSVKTSCFNTYITGSVDITTANPTPTTVPLYNLVDTLNNQTIAGDKTFSGNTTLSGNVSIGGTLGVTGATTLSSTLAVTTSVAVGGGTALTTTNSTGTGNLVKATSPTISAPAITGAMTYASTAPVANLSATPTTYNAAGTQKANTHLVRDTIALVAGTKTVTLSGSAVFTAANSYVCVGTSVTTAAAVQLFNVTASSFTINGTATDTISYICVGE